jgi:hypothetical protein
MGGCYAVMMMSLWSFYQIMLIICYCWFLGLGILDNDMTVYVITLMKFCLGYHWVLSGVVLFLAVLKHHLLLLFFSAILVGLSCLILLWWALSLWTSHGLALRKF